MLFSFRYILLFYSLFYFNWNKLKIKDEQNAYTLQDSNEEQHNYVKIAIEKEQPYFVFILFSVFWLYYYSTNFSYLCFISKWNEQFSPILIWFLHFNLIRFDSIRFNLQILTLTESLFFLFSLFFCRWSRLMLYLPSLVCLHNSIN